MNIISRLELATESHPAKPALIFFSKQSNGWKTVAYRQLADSTQRFAAGLLAGGVTPGMSAALMTPPSADFFALAFAMLKVGVIPIILDPAIGLKKVGECLAESKPDIFIGNTLTHALRVVFGWGKNSVKYNLTIEAVKGRRLKVKVIISNYQLPITNLHLPPPPPSSTPAEARAFPKARFSRMRISPRNWTC